MHRLISVEPYLPDVVPRRTLRDWRLTPSNDLLWRFDPRRLSAEEVRDTMLLRQRLAQHQGVWSECVPRACLPKFWPDSRSPAMVGENQTSPTRIVEACLHLRQSGRSLLRSCPRSTFPDPDLTCEARFMTLQPAQALSLLNGDFASRSRLRALPRGCRFERIGPRCLSSSAVIEATLGREGH